MARMSSVLMALMLTATGAATGAVAARCKWVGHCLKDPCATDDDCDGKLVCSSGACSKAKPTPKPRAGGCPSGWTAAVGTVYDSWPQPGTQECVQYSGCRWAGQFASLDSGSAAPCNAPAKWLDGGDGHFDCRYPEAVVKTWNVAATYGQGLAALHKQVSIMLEGVPGKTATVNVIDQCANSDCGGCCGRNTGGGKYALLDLEKWPASKLLGFDPTVPGFDVNNLDLPDAKGKRPGAPEASVMPLCYKVLGPVVGVP